MKMKVCDYCSKGILQFKLISYKVSVYGATVIPVGKVPANVCSYCNEEFFDLISINDANKKALKILHFKYMNCPDTISGTIAGWMRIKMKISRDSLTIDTESLKKCERDNLYVPVEIATTLLDMTTKYLL